MRSILKYVFSMGVLCATGPLQAITVNVVDDALGLKSLGVELRFSQKGWAYKLPNLPVLKHSHPVSLGPLKPVFISTFNTLASRTTFHGKEPITVNVYMSGEGKHPYVDEVSCSIPGRVTTAPQCSDSCLQNLNECFDICGLSWVVDNMALTITSPFTSGQKCEVTLGSQFILENTK